jgi:hypothetical protein
MLLTAVRDVLAASGPVTALCSTRIEIMTKPQGILFPAVCLSIVSITPVNGLETWNGLDLNLVQVDSFATTATVADELASACRTAMVDAGYQMEDQFPNFDPEVDIAGLQRVTQQFSV